MSKKDIKFDFSSLTRTIPGDPKFWGAKELGTFFKIINFPEIKNIICKK